MCFTLLCITPIEFILSIDLYQHVFLTTPVWYLFPEPKLLFSRSSTCGLLDRERKCSHSAVKELMATRALEISNSNKRAAWQVLPFEVRIFECTKHHASLMIFF